MSLSPHRLLLVLVGVAVLGFAVMITWTILQVPSRRPLPDPNGYDDFVKAGKAVVGDTGTFPDLDLDGLRGVVSSNAEPLRLLRLGLSRGCSVPTEAALTNFNLVASDLIKLKSVAQLLRAKGRLAEMEGQPIDAAKAYIEAIRFGNEISRGGFVIHRLVGISCEAIGAIPLAKLVPDLGSEQDRPLLGQLERMDDRRVSFDEIRQNESRLARHELLKESNPLKWISGWWEARAIVKHSEMRHKAVIAHERLLTVEIALRCYRVSRARPPARLEDLMTNYLSRVPLDPFSAQPLTYRPQGTNWLLYSLGPDGIDDGGRPVGKGLSAKGDMFFDSPW